MSRLFQNIIRQGNLALALLAVLAFAGLASPSAHAIGFTGYSPVPGNVKSTLTPTSVVFNGSRYVFTVGTDHRVYYNVFNGSGWSGSNSVPGNGYTNAPVAAVVYFGTYLYVFLTTTGNNVYYTTFNGSGWSGSYVPTPNNGYTPNSLPVGVAEYNNLLYVFLTGNDGHIYYQFYDGFYGTWSGYASVPNNGYTTVGVTPVVKDGHLILFLVGSNGHPYITVLNNSSWSTYSAVLPDTGVTSGSVSATVFNNQIYMFLVGTNGHIYYNSSGGGGNGGSNFSWSGYNEAANGGVTYSNESVGLDVYNNQLDVFIQSTYGDLFLSSGS